MKSARSRIRAGVDVKPVKLGDVPAVVITANEPRGSNLLRLLGALRRGDYELARSFADALCYRDAAVTDARRDDPDLFSMATHFDTFIRERQSK